MCLIFSLILYTPPLINAHLLFHMKIWLILFINLYYVFLDIVDIILQLYYFFLKLHSSSTAFIHKLSSSSDIILTYSASCTSSLAWIQPSYSFYSSFHIDPRSKLILYSYSHNIFSSVLILQKDWPILPPSVDLSTLNLPSYFLSGSKFP